MELAWPLGKRALLVALPAPLVRGSSARHLECKPGCEQSKRGRQQYEAASKCPVPRSSESSIFSLTSGLKTHKMPGFVQDENSPCTEGLGIIQRPGSWA